MSSMLFRWNWYADDSDDEEEIKMREGKPISEYTDEELAAILEGGGIYTPLFYLEEIAKRLRAKNDSVTVHRSLDDVCKGIQNCLTPRDGSSNASCITCTAGDERRGILTCRSLLEEAFYYLKKFKDFEEK